jgi:altronate dehydratase
MISEPIDLDPFSASGAVPLHKVAIHLHPQDNVAIAKMDLAPGITLILESRTGSSAHVPLKQPIPSGHKVAIQQIDAGEAVRRYGQVIGLASQAIQAGGHVHTQNVSVQDSIRELTFEMQEQTVEPLPEGKRRTFHGYRRTDGRVGTRNYLAVISSVNCSAHVTQEIAHHFTPERLAAYPNVDGVAAFTHHSGCTFRAGSRDHVLLQRTLAGIARHPNVGPTCW